ncbi:ABC transporter ATP-binding protein [Corticibacter populi]|uniref:ABC transporter ATP-binding protein n=1 Tax=Corticibacter populi TaxID=1550736 RepID=A0A3M6QSX3_9BURK|nr:ABC transporter ATP-binding protein [Corticibacter populi]RMX05659.1 ABC transporter ATP-binding protein [Corticibacter populi]RZS31060.1 iron complex transport system ATP-binding protein [Corticibacter populi]
MPQPPLITQGLQVGYGERRVVESADLSFAPASLTVLLGPNGSGKSTLLGALARQLPARAGAVLLHGRDIHRLPSREVARQLGILPQAPVLPESMTVLDLVSFGRHPHQGWLRQWSDADSEAVEHAMRLTGTLDYAARAVDSLSGGQRQRCWIAMALAQQTGIILLDEPTTFLDLKYQVEIMDLLHDLVHGHGRTIVAVLHDLNFAMAYADQLVLMKDGRVKACLADAAACTPELVKDVFDVEVTALPGLRGGRPLFIPLAHAHPSADHAARHAD